MSTNNTVNIPLFDNTTKETNPFFVANAKITHKGGELQDNLCKYYGKSIITSKGHFKNFLIIIEKRELKPFIDKALRNTDISFILKKDYSPNNQKQNIFVLGKSLKQYAFDNNFIYIDTAFCKGFLNITEPLEALPPEKLKHFILFALGVNSRIKNYADDIDSIKVPHCFNLSFNQYLGQKEENQYGFVPLDFILYSIKRIHKTILQSAAGTGKSALCMDLAKRRKERSKLCTNVAKNIKYLEVERIIILEPTTTITQQQTKDFLANGISATAIFGGSTKEEKARANDSDVLIVCYDSFSSIAPNLIETSLIILDEYHQLVIDFDFRNKKAFRTVFNSLNLAKRTLMLSATPNYLFCETEKLNENFGYTLIKGIPSVQNSIEIQPILFKGRAQDIPVFVMENEPVGEGVVLGKFDSKKMLNTLLKNAQNKKLHLDVFYSNSTTNSRKEENPNYLSIIDSGLFHDKKLRYLWFTSLMEAGVSIKELVKLMALVDVPSWQKVIQLINRARYNAKNGVNKNLPVWLFRSEKSNENSPQCNKITSINYYLEVLGRATGFCYLYNILGKPTTNQEEKRKPKTLADANDHKNITYFCDVDMIHKPCILGILRCVYEKETNVSLGLMLKRIKRFDNSITILPPKHEHTVKNDDFEAIKKEQKIEKELAGALFSDLLKTDTNNTIDIVCYLSKDPIFKEWVRSVMNLPPTNKSTLLDIMENSKGAFTGEEPKRIIKDISFLVENDNKLSKVKIIDFVLNSDKEVISSYKSQLGRNERKHYVINKPSMLTAPVHFEYEREKAILKAIDTLKNNALKGNRNEWSKADALVKIINKAVFGMVCGTGEVFKTLSKQKALATIKDIYHIESKQIQKGKKRTWYYKIGMKKTLKELQKTLEN